MSNPMEKEPFWPDLSCSHMFSLQRDWNSGTASKGQGQERRPTDHTLSLTHSVTHSPFFVGVVVGTLLGSWILFSLRSTREWNAANKEWSNLGAPQLTLVRGTLWEDLFLPSMGSRTKLLPFQRTKASSRKCGIRLQSILPCQKPRIPFRGREIN